jgi:hypothetical protein
MTATYFFMRIDDDPTSWRLSHPIAAADLTSSGTPFRATIDEPRTGTLLLASQAVASVVLAQGPLGASGATPNGGGVLAEPFLYLPSATGLTSKAPGYMYELPVHSGLTALAAVTTAMSQGELCTVELTHGAVVVLNGASLRFAVFFDAALRPHHQNPPPTPG